MSLLFDESLEIYRQLEIKEGVKALKQIENGKEGPDYFRGAMAMLRSIINLPAKLAGAESEDQRKQAEVLKLKALDLFEAKMVRSYLEE
jgi:hypothetical protein